MEPDDLLVGLPGEELVREGLADIRQGRMTVAADLVAIGFPRLRLAGLFPETAGPVATEVELSLYRHLLVEGGDAYGRYNALLRRLCRFERALDHRLRVARATDLNKPAAAAGAAGRPP